MLALPPWPGRPIPDMHQSYLMNPVSQLVKSYALRGMATRYALRERSLTDAGEVADPAYLCLAFGL